jgi:hypothetical protein
MQSLENQRLQAKSGNVSKTDPLIGFFYDLMRDHLPPGDVEQLVQNQSSKETQFTNGWLANYAEDLASRLRPIQIQYQEVVEKPIKRREDLTELAALKAELSDLERTEFKNKLTSHSTNLQENQYVLPSIFQSPAQPPQTQTRQPHSNFAASVSGLFAQKI